MKLHLFNPENDLALAHGEANYTPSPQVRAFHASGAALPLWYAAPGDAVLVPGVDARWWADTCARYGLDVELRSDAGGDFLPVPWGWSANAVRQFQRAGLSDAPWPDVALYRQLSHRRTAMALYRELDGTLPYPLPAAPMELTDASLLPDTPIFMKAPWSGSGRGVMDCTLIPRRQALNQAAGIIRRQGSVLVEPKLKKLRDFALLYMVDESGAHYQGLSLFFNGTANAYGGNIVAPQPELEAELGVDIHPTATAMEAALTRLLVGRYQGPVGVDMMLYESTDGNVLICPTVEVNLRMTMGFVALALSRRFRGTLRITLGPAPGLPLIPSGHPFSITLQ